MQQIATKNTGDSLSAVEFNGIPSEIENAIESAGIVLTGADLFQLAKAMAHYVATAAFYTDTGSANTYVLAPINNNKSFPAYADGASVTWIAGNSNTGASTLNVDGLGVISLRDSAGVALASGAVQAGSYISAAYHLTSGQFRLRSLDAVTLGGLAASQFLRSDQNDTLNGSLTVTNDIILSGNSGSVLFGKEVGGTNKQIARIDSSDFVELGSPSNSCQIVHSGVLLSNSDEILTAGNYPLASQFLRSDQNDTLNGSLTVTNDITLTGNSGSVIFGKEVGGTLRSMLRMDSFDNVEVGSANNPVQIINNGTLTANLSTIYHEDNFPSDAGDPNTYAWLAVATQGAGIAVGASFVGGDLRYAGLRVASLGATSSVASTAEGGTPIGTWEAMGGVTASGTLYPVTMFVRKS